MSHSVWFRCLLLGFGVMGSLNPGHSAGWPLVVTICENLFCCAQMEHVGLFREFPPGKVCEADESTSHVPGGKAGY